MAVVGDLYECRFFCTKGDQTSITVRHYNVGQVGGAGLTDLQLAERVGALYGPLFKGVMSGSANYYGVGVRRIQPVPIGLEVFSSNQSGPGVGTGDPLPTQISGLIQLKTQFGGRSFKGRVYVPFPGETANEVTGLPGVAYITAVAPLRDAFVGPKNMVVGVDSVTLTNVIWSRTLNITTIITNGVIPSKWSTMRSRGSFGRVNVPPF